MLTKKVRRLRKEAGTLFVPPSKSDEIFNELIDNCRPTAKEFSKISDGLTMTAGGMYRLIMEAKEKWD